MEPSLPQIQQAITLGQIIVALLPLATIAQIAIAIWAGRRKPGVTEEVYRDYATKKELADLRYDFNKSIGELFSRQHLNQQSIDDQFKTLIKDVGNLNGQIFQHLKNT